VDTRKYTALGGRVLFMADGVISRKIFVINIVSQKSEFLPCKMKLIFYRRCIH